MTMSFGIISRLWTGKLTAFVMVAVASTPATAGEQVLWSFTGGSDGASPYAGLALDSSGANLFGATFSGGANGQGVVFKMPTTGGTPTILYPFAGTSTDGSGPRGTPAVDGSGDILGTTVYQNVDSKGNVSGYGSVYELIPNTTGSYTFKNLHNFVGGNNDGGNPYAGLSRDSNGNYYGATLAGAPSDLGIVFKVVKGTGNNYTCCTNLHTFTGGSSDGAKSSGGVIYSSFDNNLYGTTVVGGSSAYLGEVFRMSTSGSSNTIIHGFSGIGNDGGYSRTAVTVDQNGTVYGTAQLYGSGSTSSMSGDGVVFQLIPSGNSYIYKNLHSFTGSGVDGDYPWSSLCRDANGNLYGTTTYGGAYGHGVLFELTYQGGAYSYSTLYSFTGGSDGSTPYAAVTMDSNGTLYGTTTQGGANGKGVVFKYTPKSPFENWIAGFSVS